MERDRKAREKLEAEVRERAQQQERQKAEEQERQRRAAEEARQRAEAERQRAAQPVQPVAPQQQAPAEARSVRQICTGRSNFVSEQLCRSRECRKAEFAGDPICVRLKEQESMQQRGGQQ